MAAKRPRSTGLSPPGGSLQSPPRSRFRGPSPLPPRTPTSEERRRALVERDRQERLEKYYAYKDSLPDRLIDAKRGQALSPTGLLSPEERAFALEAFEEKHAPYKRRFPEAQFTDVRWDYLKHALNNGYMDTVRFSDRKHVKMWKVPALPKDKVGIHPDFRVAEGRKLDTGLIILYADSDIGHLDFKLSSGGRGFEPLQALFKKYLEDLYYKYNARLEKDRTLNQSERLAKLRGFHSPPIHLMWVPDELQKRFVRGHSWSPGKRLFTTPPRLGEAASPSYRKASLVAPFSDMC